MKRITTILSAVVFLFFITGCDNLLNLEPYQSISETIALDSDVNVKSVLHGAYTQFDNAAIYGGCILRNSELLAAGNECFWAGTYTGPRQIFNHEMNSSNSDVEAQWTNSYQVINICNNVLSALSIVVEEDRDRVEGEALFLRSLMFFDLVRFYAQQYDAATAATQMGIPLVLTPTRGINSGSYVGRNTVAEVYAKIITDLITAASKLTEENDVYATSGAANALLARVYLQKGDWSNARVAANAVISSPIYSLQTSYADVFNNDENTSEDIFATQITPQDAGSSMTEFFSTPQYGGRGGDIDVLTDHLNLYAAGDERKDLFYFDMDQWRSGKWNNVYGVVNLIRLAEMYLIRAEANKMIDATEVTFVGAKPLDDYNRIHQRAGLPAALSITVADIRYERRLELSFEGFMIHDARRLHNTVDGLPYNSPKLVFPIPLRETEANPTLKAQQNPGY
jgi:starch-binding outer membrane protein, SusD/RagB family